MRDATLLRKPEQLFEVISYLEGVGEERGRRGRAGRRKRREKEGRKEEVEERESGKKGERGGGWEEGTDEEEGDLVKPFYRCILP